MQVAIPTAGVSEFERGGAVNDKTKKDDEKRKKDLAAKKAAAAALLSAQLEHEHDVKASKNVKTAKHRKKGKRDSVK